MSVTVKHNGFTIGEVDALDFSGVGLSSSNTSRKATVMSSSSKVASTSPTPGATVTIDPTLGNLYTWTAGENETVNISGTQVAGQVITFMITNDAVIRTITLGTGIVSTGVIVGTALKTAVVVLQSNGTSFYELSRTLGL